MPDQTHITDQFRQAREEKADEVWAASALVELANAEVATAERNSALHEALALVRESGEPAVELFGDGREWGREKAQELAEQGGDFVRNDTDWPTALSVGVVIGGINTLLFAIISFLREGLHQDWNLGMVLAPALLAAMAMATLTVWERSRRSRSLGLSLALTVATVLVGAGALAGLFFATGTDGVPLGQHSTLWWLAPLAGWAGLAWALPKVLPEDQEQVVRVSSDEQWITEARAGLRERGDRSDADIEARLAEARDHAAASGRPLAVEFGNPRGFATGVPVDKVRASRLKAWFSTAMAALYTALVFWVYEPVGWWHYSLLVIIVMAAAGQWWEHLRVRRAR